MKKKDFCFIDVETASDVDISQGVVRYANSKKFHILSIAYKINDSDVKVLTNFDRSKKAPELPEELLDFSGCFVSHNWVFEFACLNIAYRNSVKIFRDTDKWLCTAALARYFAIDDRAKLETVAVRLGLPEKLQDGKRLIAAYSLPNKSGAFNVISELDAQAWIEYNKRDVELTAEIFWKLYPHWPAFEKKVWQAHKAIAADGVPIDTKAAENLKKHIDKIKENAEKEAESIAGRTPGGALVLTSQKEFLNFLAEKHKLKLPDAREATLKSLVGRSAELDKILELRKILSSRAADKTEQILERVIHDRIYDPFVYCGTHTGRWASWGVNFFNFSRENSPTDDEYETLLNKKTLSLDEIKSMQRGLVSPQRAFNCLVISDFKSIELHLLLYCADDRKQLEILESGKSLYTYFGEKAFGKKVEKGTKEYQIAKSAVLGLGYGAGANVFATLAGIDIETSRRVARIWRENNQNIVRFWGQVEDAFMNVATGRTKSAKLPRGIIVEKIKDKNGVKTVLPNGFEIFYPLVDTKDTYLSCSWDGGATYHNLWGGLLTENIMQSLCRQLLADSLVKLRHRKIDAVLHVYDEIVCEVVAAAAQEKAKEIAEIMTEERPWLPGFRPQVEQHIARRWGK